MNLSWTDSVWIGAVSVKPFWTYFYKILSCLQKSMISSPIPHFLVKDHFLFPSAPWREGVVPTSHVADNTQKGQAGSAHSQSACFSSGKLTEVVHRPQRPCVYGVGRGNKSRKSSKEVQLSLAPKYPRKAHPRSPVLRKRLLGSCAHHTHGAYKWPPNAPPHPAPHPSERL